MVRKLKLIVLSGLICILAATPVWAAKYNEAPMLKVKVAAGELLPVEERLPDEPQIVKPVEEIGEYGGTAHLFSTSITWADDPFMLGGVEPMFRIAPDCKTVVPNIAKKWDFSTDGKTLTLYLRKGMKWSDGADFTANDVMFWYEDMLLNQEITPVISKNWSPGGQPMIVEKVDDYTLRLNFAAPYPLITLLLCEYQGIGLAQPKHYLEQFHIKYNPEANELAKEEGFNAWYEYFGERANTVCGLPSQPDLPTVSAYTLAERTTTYLVYERNPYYWKVDTEGNQLPYIDKMNLGKVETGEMYNAKIVSGQADFAGEGTSFDNFPLYKENAEQGDYRVLLWKSTLQSRPVYQVNQTHKDPVLRKIFRDVRFRRALSLAINREEINEDIYFGQAVAGQMTVLPASKYYKPEFEQAYAEYNTEEANRLLDEMGLKWDKNHEYRLRPDGKRLAWTLETHAAAFTPTNELVKEYWEAIGCQMTVKLESQELVQVRVPANELDMGLWSNGRASDFLFPLGPMFFVPYHLGQETTWGVEWAQWYITEGEKGEEPPENIKKLYEWWERMKTTTDEEENIDLGRKILASQAENLWCIGTVGMYPQVVIVRSNLRNIPQESLWGWDVMYTFPAHPEQFFFKGPLLPSQK